MNFWVFSHVDQSKYFISFVLVNDHHGNVIVTTNVSGRMEIDNLKPKATVMKKMKWVTKKLVTVSAVEASTNESVNINGQPVFHLEPTNKELISTKFLHIKGKNFIFKHRQPCLFNSFVR